MSGGRSGRFVRVMMLALLSCALMLTLAHAQTGRDEKKAEEAASLDLKLTAYEARVCPRSSLTLTLEATNTGQKQVKIYKLNLWSQFKFSKVGSQYAGSSISCGVDDGKSDNWIVLEPGEKFYDTRNYPLEWTQYFQEPGHYKLSTSLQFYVGGKYEKTVPSSEVEFEVYDCAAK